MLQSACDVIEYRFTCRHRFLCNSEIAQRFRDLLQLLLFRIEASDAHNFDETHADHKYTVQGGRGG